MAEKQSPTPYKSLMTPELEVLRARLEVQAGPIGASALYGRDRLEKSDSVIEELKLDKLTGFMRGDMFIQDIGRIAERLNSKEAGADRRSVVLLIGDLKGLKRVNDNLGHSEGNKYIKTSAQASLEGRIDDRGYRLGDRSDEFALLLRGVRKDPNGNYLTTIDKIISAKEMKVDSALREAGLPVDELRLGITLAGGVLELGQAPDELFKSVDAQLAEKHSLARASLPENLRHDDRLI